MTLLKIEVPIIYHRRISYRIKICVIQLLGWKIKTNALPTHNTPLSAALSTRPTKQICNFSDVRRKRVRIALALNIQPHQRLRVRAAQVEAPIPKDQAHAICFIYGERIRTVG